MRKCPAHVNLGHYVILGLLVLWISDVLVLQAEAEDVYSLFGKLFLSGRVEYDFTNRRDFLADTEAEQIRKNDFDFDRVFRRGFHSVMVIEETAGNVKNILSLGEVPTTFTKSTFDRIDFSGVRWDIRAERTDWTFIMVPSHVNPVVGREDLEGSGFGIREVTKFGKSKLGLSWYFRDTPVWAIDTETNFANYGFRGELAVTPMGALDRTFSSRFDATTTVFKGFRTVGDTIFQAEVFRVGHLFDASRSVGDNDDGDRYTDNTGEDPPSLIIPGDLDKNNNGTFDYEDDILLFDVDEDFLDESDRNNNGIRDEEENDKDPNYEFDVGLRGMRLLMQRKTSREDSSTDVELGMQFERSREEGNAEVTTSSTKAFWDLIYRKKPTQNTSVIFENELKFVQDRIPDETWYFAGFLSPDKAQLYRALPEVLAMEEAGELQFFEADGGIEVEKRRTDPLLMQNDLINTVKLTWEYSGIERMVTTTRIKLRYDLDIDQEDEHYEVGILKTLYRFRPSKSLEISPMLKYTVRNGFLMAESRIDAISVSGEIDGMPASEHVRLREIGHAHVRDMAAAVILKAVYQFTKTIKITGGGQVLFFNDMLADDNDFMRHALLAEMEKSFTAYEKELFLHIGIRYIDQRATGDVNDQNYVENFVRVFGKF